MQCEERLQQARNKRIDANAACTEAQGALDVAAQAREALTDVDGRLLAVKPQPPAEAQRQRVAQLGAFDLEGLGEEMAEQLESDLVVEAKIYAKVAAARTKKIADVQKHRKCLDKKAGKLESATPPSKEAVEAAEMAAKTTAQIGGGGVGSGEQGSSG